MLDGVDATQLSFASITSVVKIRSTYWTDSETNAQTNFVRYGTYKRVYCNWKYKVYKLFVNQKPTPIPSFKYLRCERCYDRITTKTADRIDTNIIPHLKKYGLNKYAGICKKCVNDVFNKQQDKCHTCRTIVEYSEVFLVRSKWMVGVGFDSISFCNKCMVSSLIKYHNLSKFSKKKWSNANSDSEVTDMIRFNTQVLYQELVSRGVTFPKKNRSN